ncbi:MAG: hypothetical protein M3R60_01005 [Pseudomonadota bacterium]|nr:hypothetical protein [Pseudomonadota bacterium]
MAEKFIPYDPMAFLDSIEAIEVFLNDAFETGNAAYISATIVDVARVRGLDADSDLQRPYPHNDMMPLAAAISMLDALGFRLTVTRKRASELELQELRADFDVEADERFAKVLSSGETIRWSDMRQYLSDRLAGKNVPSPVAKKKQD